MRHAVMGIVTFLAVAASSAGQAGQLVVQNVSASPIACRVDGYTAASGGGSDAVYSVGPGQKIAVPVNEARATKVIDWVECGGLRGRRMAITPKSQDHLVVLNGQQLRVLSVSLYPWIPSNPNGNFQQLVEYVILGFQATYPDVLLNLVMDQDIDIYSFTALPTLLGAGGYDVVELDTIYMGFLVQNGLVTAQTIAGDPPLPLGLNAVTIGGTAYGVPSWLCLDFLYSNASALQQVNSLAALTSFLSTQPQNVATLVADYDGKWRLPAIYMNAFAAQYGSGNIGNAFNMPPDQTVINNLATLVQTCAFNGTDNCINGVYHNGEDGTTEQVFATGNADADLGFSEQSFFIQLFGGPSMQPFVMAGVWGPTVQPLFYTDAFVTNSTTCAANPCAADSSNFSAFMTSAATKSYIAYSQDLPQGSPPRHLLVATQPFYQLPYVQQDWLYIQATLFIAIGSNFPNSWSAIQQTTIGGQVCAALQAMLPSYACQSGAAGKLRSQ